MSEANQILADARLAHARGDVHAAAAGYQRVLELGGGAAEVHYLLGTARYALGDIQGAVTSLQQAVVLNSNLAPALHYLGISLAGLGHLDDAVSHYRRAVDLTPQDAMLRNNLGAAYVMLNRLDEAADAFSAAIAIQPDYAQAYVNLGNVFVERGDLPVAIERYRSVLAFKPNDAEAWERLAGALVRQNNLDEAIWCYSRLLTLKPDYVEARDQLASLLAARGRFDEAIDCYHQVLSERPDHAGGHKNLGVVLTKVGKYDDAIARFHRALELQPGYWQAQMGLAAALSESGHLEEAAELYRRVLERRPDEADATANLATVFARQGKLEQAGATLRTLLEQNPRFARGHINLGALLTSEKEFDEALDCFQRAKQIEPGNTDAHYSNAVTLLLLGRWQAGWPEYEWRWSRRQLVGAMPNPLWDGDAMPNGTLLIHAEQGLGDTLQMVRLASLVKQRVGTVVLECQPQLASLVARTTGIGRVVARGEPLGEFDAYVPILSLPYLLHIDEKSIPRDVPYLLPARQLVEKWREEFAGQPGYKIGISWQGSPHNPSDHTRSFPLSEFRELARLPGVRLYSLQFGSGREQVPSFAKDTPLIDLGDRLGDFDNTAAIVENLDLVITCDSALAHLAGGLGAPVWVPLPLVPDWRWLLDREDSPWYPTMRLFRQSRRGEWSEPFARMREGLAKQLSTS